MKPRTYKVGDIVKVRYISAQGKAEFEGIIHINMLAQFNNSGYSGKLMAISLDITGVHKVGFEPLFFEDEIIGLWTEHIDHLKACNNSIKDIV